MGQPSTDERVRAVIAKVFQLPPEAVSGNLRMSNPPAWDSLGHMALVVALEKQFGVRFPGHMLPTLVSVDAITRELGNLSRSAC